MCIGDGCEYRESPKSAAHTYAMSHGASEINGNISHYCSYFLVRKTMASDEGKRITCTIMLKLNNFLFEKGIINKEQKDEAQEELDQCIAVEEDKIMEALSDLKAKNYWKNLPAEENHEAREITDEDELYDDSVGSEFGLTVVKVNNDGWDVRAEDLRLLLVRRLRGRRLYGDTSSSTERCQNGTSWNENLLHGLGL